jgi:hypothetical protein
LQIRFPYPPRALVGRMISVTGERKKLKPLAGMEGIIQVKK